MKTANNTNLITEYRNQNSLEAKNGIDFILSAFVVWLIIAYIWTLDFSAFEKSVFTFYAGTLMLPMAFGLSKIIKTDWNTKTNPLKPVGLWLNLSQLFYFPFLFFFLYYIPEHFIMAYAIITGAHFFPFSWFYRNAYYAVFGGIISVGSLVLATLLPAHLVYLIPLATSFSLLCLAIGLFLNYKNKLVAIAKNKVESELYEVKPAGF